MINCPKCGDYSTYCRSCVGDYLDEKLNKEMDLSEWAVQQHKEKIMQGDNDSVCCTGLRDKCDTINDLLECLELVIGNENYTKYQKLPHQSLFATIKDMVTEVEIGLAQL